MQPSNFSPLTSLPINSPASQNHRKCQNWSRSTLITSSTNNPPKKGSSPHLSLLSPKGPPWKTCIRPNTTWCSKKIQKLSKPFTPRELPLPKTSSLHWKENLTKPISISRSTNCWNIPFKTFRFWKTQSTRRNKLITNKLRWTVFLKKSKQISGILWKKPTDFYQMAV